MRSDKYFNLFNFFLFFSFFFVGCKGPAKLVNFSFNDKYVTFDKVKVSLDKNIGLRGYVTIVRDSFICFKFYGPLGYGIVGGRLASTFQIIDYFNNKNIDDAISQISGKSGVVINRKVIEDILLFNTDSLKETLLQLNPRDLSMEVLERSKGKRVVIKHAITKGEFILDYLWKTNLPKEIKIRYADLSDQWSVQIDIISVSNLSKKCNFER